MRRVSPGGSSGASASTEAASPWSRARTGSAKGELERLRGELEKHERGAAADRLKRAAKDDE